MADHSFDRIIASIEGSLNKDTYELGMREDSTVEFKESFNWANRSIYAKSMAAFANHRGGYLIFGISNEPRRLIGLKSNGFDSQDNAKVTEFLNSLFSPAIQFEKHVAEVAGAKVGFLWIAPHDSPPVMAIKTSEDVKEAEIYFRYSARSEKIKFPEMKALFDRIREKEHSSWADILSRIARLGPASLGIMDFSDGEIHGKGGTLLIDEALIPKLTFIKEGSFQEGGEPTLRLVGDVRPISGAEIEPRAFRITDDPNAPAIRDDAIYEQYPFDYPAIMKEAGLRYSDFKQNGDFHNLMRGFKNNPKFSHTRYLDPKRKKTPKMLYSREVLEELDKCYKLK